MAFTSALSRRGDNIRGSQTKYEVALRTYRMKKNKAKFTILISAKTLKQSELDIGDKVDIQYDTQDKIFFVKKMHDDRGWTISAQGGNQGKNNRGGRIQIVRTMDLEFIPNFFKFTVCREVTIEPEGIMFKAERFKSAAEASQK